MFDKALFTLKDTHKLVGVLLCTSLIYAACVLAQTWALTSALVHFFQGATVASQTGFIALFVGCFIAGQAIRTGEEALSEHFATKRARELRQDLLSTLFEAGPALIAAEGSANVITSALEGIEQVENYLAMMLPKTARFIVVSLVLFVAAWLVDWISGIVLLIVLPALLFYFMFLGKEARAQADKQHAKGQTMANHFVDSIRGLSTLKLAGCSKTWQTRIYETSERFREATMKTLRIGMLSGAAMDLFATFSLAGVAMLLGFRLANGNAELFDAMFLLILVPEFFRPIREFASDYHASLDGKTALAAILDITDKGKRIQNSHTEALPAVALPKPLPHTLRLQLTDLSFTYPDGNQALSHITFSVQAPCKIGLVGPSGCGKTTLVTLLSGFATPSEGTFTIQGNSYHSLALHEWQQHVAYIPQHPYVFSATLRENVSFYNPAASDAELMQTLEAVGLSSLLESLPEGLDTRIGEGGRALSGGQAHRVCLARALADPARTILFFDEPCAHLDIETEFELKKPMLALMENKLVFFATHRLHWLANMDYVAVLNQGKLAGFGTPEEMKPLCQHLLYTPSINGFGGEHE